MLMEGHRLRQLENRVVRKSIGLKRAYRVIE
jgi:hypothetical protein